eukprot:c4270_g1_i1 orf=513-806(+)
MNYAMNEYITGIPCDRLLAIIKIHSSRGDLDCHRQARAESRTHRQAYHSRPSWLGTPRRLDRSSCIPFQSSTGITSAHSSSEGQSDSAKSHSSRNED